MKWNNSITASLHRPYLVKLCGKKKPFNPHISNMISCPIHISRQKFQGTKQVRLASHVSRRKFLHILLSNAMLPTLKQWNYSITTSPTQMLYRPNRVEKNKPFNPHIFNMISCPIHLLRRKYQSTKQVFGRRFHLVGTKTQTQKARKNNAFAIRKFSALHITGTHMLVQSV